MTLGLALSLLDTCKRLVMEAGRLLALYLTFNVPLSPGAYFFLSKVNGVQPHVLLTFVIFNRLSPAFLKLNSQMFFDPGAMLPKSWVTFSNSIFGAGLFSSGAVSAFAALISGLDAANLVLVFSAAIACSWHPICRRQTEATTRAIGVLILLNFCKVRFFKIK